MIRRIRLFLLIVPALLLAGVPAASAQAAGSAMKEPGRAIIRIYRIAAGKHLYSEKPVALLISLMARSSSSTASDGSAAGATCMP